MMQVGSFDGGLEDRHYFKLIERKKEVLMITAQSPSSRKEVEQVAPRLNELTDTVLLGDIWERPGLSKRDRSLITVAALIVMYRTEQLPGHIKRALGNGVTREEISEIITQMAFYGGWPTGMTAARIAWKVFDEMKP
jgi:4-carboxymuconolactone decarboxylase